MLPKLKNQETRSIFYKNLIFENLHVSAANIILEKGFENNFIQQRSNFESEHCFQSSAVLTHSPQHFAVLQQTPQPAAVL